MNSNEHGHGEIIIIKRGGMEDEGHHGGAWKIAFADFMTAMMALFLVLWLINAANEETKRSVASYFNPVKLVDRNRSSKGINDQQGGPTSDTKNPAAAPVTANEINSTSAGQSEINPDQPLESADNTFFASPQEQLDLILSKVIKETAGSATHVDPMTGDKIDKFEDPFAPNVLGADTRRDYEPFSAAGLTGPERRESGLIPESSDNQPETEAVRLKNPTAKSDMVAELKAEIQDNLLKTSTNAALIDRIVEVESVDQGILISVTDQLDMPMFKVGSAVPEVPLVLAMDAVANTLASKPGKIHVYGHTDSREFKNNKSGNWKLSNDRAQATYFMLAHGGLEDTRIAEISGYADRKLRNREDPLATENRRIEILLASP